MTNRQPDYRRNLLRSHFDFPSYCSRMVSHCCWMIESRNWGPLHREVLYRIEAEMFPRFRDAAGVVWGLAFVWNSGEDADLPGAVPVPPGQRMRRWVPGAGRGLRVVWLWSLGARFRWGRVWPVVYSQNLRRDLLSVVLPIRPARESGPAGRRPPSLWQIVPAMRPGSNAWWRWQGECGWRQPSPTLSVVLWHPGIRKKSARQREQVMSGLVAPAVGVADTGPPADAV